MDLCYGDYSRNYYRPAMMTPPPEDVECNLDARSSTQTSVFMPAYREPPTPESLPRVTVWTAPHHRESSINRNSTRRRSTAASDSVLSPRDPPELLRERDYIGEELEKQSGLKRHLIRRYSAVEDDFNGLPASNTKQRRRWKKQLSKLRGQLAATGNNERVLAIRFSELCLELQSHEAWAHAHWERQNHAAPPVEYFPISPSSMSQGVSWQDDTNNSPLDARSPEFIPKGLTVDEIMAGSSQSNLETVEETGGDCSQSYSQSFEYNVDHEEEAEESEMSSYRRSSCDDEILSPRQKRLSLPNLQSLWP